MWAKKYVLRNFVVSLKRVLLAVSHINFFFQFEPLPLSVSVPKTGPLHFGPGKSFPSNFAH